MTDFTDRHDEFLFSTSDTQDDGAADSAWIDLGLPVDTVDTSDAGLRLDSGSGQEPLSDDGPTCDPSAQPVLLVVANQDFWSDNY